MPLGRYSMEDTASMISSYMKTFHREVSDAQLLLTPQAVQRVAALDRVLSVPAGAVLLCGPAGSGRKSLLQLVAHAHGLRWRCPRINRYWQLVSVSIPLLAMHCRVCLQAPADHLTHSLHDSWASWGVGAG